MSIFFIEIIAGTGMNRQGTHLFFLAFERHPAFSPSGVRFCGLPLTLKKVIHMKHLILGLVTALLVLNIGQAQSNHTFSLLGHWDDETLPIAAPDWLSLQYSGCWGITVDGREYAVLGGAEHVLFFDVTEPTPPQLVGKFTGTANTVWRARKSNVLTTLCSCLKSRKPSTLMVYWSVSSVRHL